MIHYAFQLLYQDCPPQASSNLFYLRYGFDKTKLFTNALVVDFLEQKYLAFIVYIG